MADLEAMCVRGHIPRASVKAGKAYTKLHEAARTNQTALEQLRSVEVQLAKRWGSFGVHLLRDCLAADLTLAQAAAARDWSLITKITRKAAVRRSSGQFGPW
jgi:hypothetical protein